MRNRFEEQLTLLNRNMIQMGALCEEAITNVMTGLQEKDATLFQLVKRNSDNIDQYNYEIESLCMRLLLQQQPVARDLRQISAALKMITDMKRIGNQAEDIAEIMASSKGPSFEQYPQIEKMAEATIHMVTRSIDAYVQRDVALAKAVIHYDDVVDNYFHQVKASIIDYLSHSPEDGEFAIDLLMISKYFERIGDHTTNIARWVIYSVTGAHKGEQ